MIDSQFRLFAEKNILSLDELSRIFAEYKIAVSESFWENLSNELNIDIPDGYSYHTEGKRFDNGGALDERTCGWKRDISGLIGVMPRRDIVVCFGNYVSKQQLSLGEWPLYRPWTGIKVWLDEKRAEETKILTAIDQQRSLIKSEPRDNNWHFYRHHPQLDIKAVGLLGSYDALVGATLPKNLETIKTELIEWVKLIEDILLQVQ